MIAIALTIAASVAVGVACEQRWGEGSERAARGVLAAILYAFVPFIVFFNLARLEVDTDVAGGLLFAHLMLLAVGGLAYVAGKRLLHLDRSGTGALMVAVMQVNTGYVGLPLVVALLGSDALAEAAAYDAIVTAPVLFGAVFAVGAAFGSKAGDTAGERIRSFFVRNPPLLAVIAALLAPDSLAPDALVDASRVLVFALVPLGFFAVGVILGREAEDGDLAVPPPLSRPVLAVLGLRLLVAPALLFALAAPFIDLPASYLIQAAMPCGINSLVVAHVYGLDLKLVSSAVAWSTAIVIAGGLVASVV
ncbi:MAG: AEC family transporter [Solirubrobacteraceae bacterium]